MQTNGQLPPASRVKAYREADAKLASFPQSAQVAQMRAQLLEAINANQSGDFESEQKHLIKSFGG